MNRIILLILLNILVYYLYKYNKYLLISLFIFMIYYTLKISKTIEGNYNIKDDYYFIDNNLDNDNEFYKYNFAKSLNDKVKRTRKEHNIFYDVIKKLNFFIDEYQDKEELPNQQPCIGEFTPWSECSRTCGLGSQYRKYNIIQKAGKDGIKCIYEDGDLDEKSCDNDPCEKDEECDTDNDCFAYLTCSPRTKKCVSNDYEDTFFPISSIFSMGSSPTPTPGPSPPTPPGPSPPGPSPGPPSPPTPPSPPGQYMDIKNQTDNTVQIINDTSDNPMYIFLEYSNCSGSTCTLNAPSKQWSPPPDKKIGKLTDPMKYGPGEKYEANDVGAGTWQVLELNKKESIILDIPDFSGGQAWSIRPVKKNSSGKYCSQGRLNPTGCGMPILIESGKDIVGDMSAADGVNYKLKYELTTKNNKTNKNRYTTIDMNTNPCPDGKGPCINPQLLICKGLTSNDADCKSELFKLNTGPNTKKCYHGTCNLKSGSDLQKYCDNIHYGQCSDSTHTYENATKQDPNCGNEKNKYTTYCYDYDDANSQPYFTSPYKMKLTYTDL